MPRPSPLEQGFSLLELVVALTIFALIGLGSHAMLQSLIRARDTEARHSRQLAQLQSAVWLLEQDFGQMDTRSLTLPSGNYAVSFERRGADLPSAHPRSNLLQVAYRLEGQTLRRDSWSAETRDAAPQSQLLIDGVSFFAVRPFAPGAIEVVFTTGLFGAIRRVIEVPQT